MQFTVLCWNWFTAISWPWLHLQAVHKVMNHCGDRPCFKRSLEKNCLHYSVLLMWAGYTHGERSLHSLMELSPSWEAVNCAATQELPSILQNPKDHYRVHKSPPLVPTEPDQSNPSHPISLKSILMLSTHLHLGLPSGLYPSGIPTNILHAFLFSPIRATCPAHLLQG
jgi:hypothetical protein